jgi:hypothetical protein
VPSFRVVLGSWDIIWQIRNLEHGTLGTCTRAEEDFGWLNSSQALRCGSAVLNWLACHTLRRIGIPPSKISIVAQVCHSLCFWTCSLLFVLYLLKLCRESQSIVRCNEYCSNALSSRTHNIGCISR